MNGTVVSGTVVAVHRSAGHHFSKDEHPAISLLPGLGVDGDAHLGVTVQHRSRARLDPSQPNLRQVHLRQAELLDEVTVAPGELGENITTRGIDLLGMSAGTLLAVGASAVVEVTGLRNPCVQIEAFRPRLLQRVIGPDEHGDVVRRAGVMGVVLAGGPVRPGDDIVATARTLHVRLQPV